MQTPDRSRTHPRSGCQPGTPCPYAGHCATPDDCAKRRSCALGNPAPGRLYLLAPPPYPYPLRRDIAPRATWPAGVQS